MTIDDDLLLDRLRQILDDVDPVPPLVTANAWAALGTRRLDAELAELVADSALDAVGSVRDSDGVRLLSFETMPEFGTDAEAVCVELQLTPTVTLLTLRGLVTGGDGEVVVETAGETRVVALDGAGWFTVGGIRPGPLRLQLRAGAGGRVVTSWVSV